MRFAEQIEKRLGFWWAGYAFGLAAVALMTAVISLVITDLHIPNASMLYLIVVLAVAIGFGGRPAVFVSVVAFLTFNWFFVQPLHTLFVANPGEWVSLLLFLITAVITGQLAAAQRQRAQEAAQREHETALMYDVARLMSELSLRDALRAVAERLRRELALAAVSVEIFDGTGISTRTEAGDVAALQAERRLAPTPGPAPAEGQRGAVVRAHGDLRLQLVPVVVGGHQVGEIALLHPAAPAAHLLAEERLASAVATQIGTAVERARLRREATETEILRRADELKSALLNAVSHDLRTPLASIIASAGSLRRADVTWSEEDTREFAAGIEGEALRLNHIVGNLLDLSRMEGGSLRIEKGWYDLGALVDDVLGRLHLLLARHQVRVAAAEDLPPVHVDYLLIDQVLSNLVENAARYSPAGGEIEITAERYDGEVQVAVADRGPGIPAAALGHIFEPFYRAGEQGPRTKGSGLGLAVARGLVEAHGGRIFAENRPGGGARFVFTLPLAAATEKLAGVEEVRG